MFSLELPATVKVEGQVEVAVAKLQSASQRRKNARQVVKVGITLNVT